MKNYRIVEITTGTDEKYYVVQKECRTLFRKKWKFYHRHIDGYENDQWTSFLNYATRYWSIGEARNVIVGFKRDELSGEIKSIRVLSNEEVDSCC